MTYFKILTTVYRYLPLHKVEYDFQTFLLYCLAAGRRNAERAIAI